LFNGGKDASHVGHVLSITSKGFAAIGFGTPSA
jgi:hypothetical protein